MNIYEKRFFFITDDILRKNMGYALQHSTELVAILDKYPRAVRSSFYKTIILHTASIIEAALHFCLRKTFTGKPEIERWKYIEIKTLHTFDDTKSNTKKEVIAGIRFKKCIDLNNLVDFKNINDICKKEEVFSEKTYNDVEKIRILRNKQHLISLTTKDRGYNKKTLNAVFKTAKTILDIVEKRLKNK
jgi:hypothetical protein